MTKLRIAFVGAFIVVASLSCYVATQEPRAWLDRGFGVALTKGGYRWLSVRFYDTKVEGKPALLDEYGNARPGRYWVPHYEYCDARSFDRSVAGQ